MKEFNLNTNYVIYKDGRIFSKYSNKFLKIKLDNSGYMRVCLTVEKGKSSYFLLHRLLASHFIPNL